MHSRSKQGDQIFIRDNFFSILGPPSRGTTDVQWHLARLSRMKYRHQAQVERQAGRLTQNDITFDMFTSILSSTLALIPSYSLLLRLFVSSLLYNTHRHGEHIVWSFMCRLGPGKPSASSHCFRMENATLHHPTTWLRSPVTWHWWESRTSRQRRPTQFAVTFMTIDCDNLGTKLSGLILVTIFAQASLR